MIAVWLWLCIWLHTASAADVTVWHAYSGQEAQALQEACDTWSAHTPHRVNLVQVPFGAFDSKVETAVPRGNGPDLFISGHSNLQKWAAMNLMQPVQGSLVGHRQQAIDALSLDGTPLGWPLALKSAMLLYDPSKIAAPPKTTDELIALAREHTHGDAFGLAYEAATPYYHGAWLHGFGTRGIESDGSVDLDAQAHIDAMRFSKRLAIDEGVVPQQPTGPLISQLYDEGRAAMVISGPWFVADQKRPIAAAPLPVVSATGKPAMPYLTVEAVFLADQAAEPQAARELAIFLSEIDGATLRSERGRQAVTWEAVQSDDPLVRAMLEQAAQSVPIPSSPDILNVFEAQARGLRDVFRGSTTPEQAAAGAQTYYSILSRPPPPPVSPWPYMVVLAIGLLAALAYAFAPLRHAAERKRVWAHRYDYLWIGPAFFAMSLLVALPFVTGAGVSLFAHYRGEWSFVGFNHFLDILLSRDWPITSPLSFGFTLVVTVLWTIANLTLHVGLGMALALMLREPWIRMRAVFRALLIIPWAVPNYITALIWKGMFHTQFGAINAILGVLTFQDGPAKLDWFGSFATAFAANLATNTWLGFPFMMVVTLGALQSIPRELEEAAEIDGANAIQRFRHVIWPMLKPALLPAVILGSVWTFNMFNVVYLVSAGEPNSATEILISEAYRWAFSRGNRYGYAAAYAVLIFFVLLAYSRGANRLAGQKVL